MENLASLNKLTTISPNNLDLEWLTLILQAKNMGITVDEIREFLKNDKFTLSNR